MAPRAKRSLATLQRPQPQSAEAVARRCIVLIAVVASGHGDRRSKLIPWLKREGLIEHVSAREMRVLRAKSLPLRDRAYATWRMEAIVPLLWALRRLPKLAPPSEKDFSIAGCMPLPLEPTAEFIAEATLRSVRVLRREQDLVYNLHWKVRDAQISGKRLPRGLDAEVIIERHYAMNWLLNDEGQSWDDVSTDT